MRTKSILGVVLCFGVAFAMIGGSGLGGAIFGEAPDEHDTIDVIEDNAENASVDEDDGGGLVADVASDSEPTLVGVAISAGQFAASLVGAVVLLPITLMQLGMPTYAAVPLGGMAQIVAFIGLAQFVRGTEYL